MIQTYTRKQHNLKIIRIKNAIRSGKKVSFQSKFPESDFLTHEQTKHIQTTEINKWFSYIQKIGPFDFKIHCTEQIQMFLGDDVIKGNCTLKTIFKRVY